MALADRIEALEEAIQSGHLSVRYEDKQVTYRSLEEMRSILEEMKGQQEGTSGIERRGAFGGRRFKASFSKGL